MQENVSIGQDMKLILAHPVALKRSVIDIDDDDNISLAELMTPQMSCTKKPKTK